ncbi:Na(+)-translocating NADH-quinone reductase subunit A [bacterium]|nr:Na(+)-translocating NADH-quinone reductase subunit A [bacterium]
MSKEVRIKRGLNLKLKGKAEKQIHSIGAPSVYALLPIDFPGLTPKMLVKEGDEVRAGQPVFCDKRDERIVYCAPVSGEVASIDRGPKRIIEAVRILPDSEQKYEEVPNWPAQGKKEEVQQWLMACGAWPFVRQRPYAVVADPAQTPKSIHISCFNSAPLAADLEFALHSMEGLFAAGVEVLKKLTPGKIHLNVDGSEATPRFISETKGVEVNRFFGPHPASNIGVQIHHLDPLNKGEVVWYVQPQDVVLIGRLANEHRYETERTAAVCGSGVDKPHYVKARIGAQLLPLLHNNLKPGKQRVISGDVLTGRKAGSEGFLGTYHAQVTVIPEGDQPEFFGWLSLDPKKFSISRTLFAWLNPNKEYELDTNMHGEERAFVVSGEYEKVFPFDLYPVPLIKAIMAEDIDRMERLGIYEVAEEDFALCEVVCTSKLPLQETVRHGLDLVRKEMM